MLQTLALCLFLVGDGSAQCDPLDHTRWPDQLSKAQVYDVLEIAGWPMEYRDQAAFVVWEESHNKRHDRRPEFGTEAVGLFQIHTSPWLRYCGRPFADMTDPVVSAEIAWCIFDGHDGREWDQWAWVATGQ
jgi:hypothetical protein